MAESHTEISRWLMNGQRAVKDEMARAKYDRCPFVRHIMHLSGENDGELTVEIIPDVLMSRRDRSIDARKDPDLATLSIAGDD